MAGCSNYDFKRGFNRLFLFRYNCEKIVSFKFFFSLIWDKLMEYYEKGSILN